MNTVEISTPALALGYLLLLIPLSLMMWTGVPLVRKTWLAVVRMTVQLLFVGLYLQVVFRIDHYSLTLAWLIAMILVADISIVRGCDLRLGRFYSPLFIALFAGTMVPLIYMVSLLFDGSPLLKAQYAIPIGGMILGNCLRADIIGISRFYESLKKDEKSYLHALAQGARLSEATRPYLRDAFHAALAPTIATMSTIGLVSLPGMMTGVILAGANPMMAIKYQILIMLAIFSGTALTVALAIVLTRKSSFTAYGILDKTIFKAGPSKKPKDKK
ncbi:MAG: ABC transporter permease [Planctomycetota bacterium]